MITVCKSGRNVRPGDVIDYGDGTFTVDRFEPWIAPTGQSGRTARDAAGSRYVVRDAETVRLIIPETPVSAFAGQRADTGLNARSGQEDFPDPCPLRVPTPRNDSGPPRPGQEQSGEPPNETRISVSTGPEHFREAERLLEQAKFPRRIITGIGDDAAFADAWEASGADASTVVLDAGVQIHDMTLAAAQVHATLALAAATALANAPTLASVAHTEAWTAVAS